MSLRDTCARVRSPQLHCTSSNTAFVASTRYCARVFATRLENVLAMHRMLLGKRDQCGDVQFEELVNVGSMVDVDGRSVFGHGLFQGYMQQLALS